LNLPSSFSSSFFPSSTRPLDFLVHIFQVIPPIKQQENHNNAIPILNAILPLGLALLATKQVSAAGPPYSCSFYEDCKCHDSNGGLQNDDATKKACQAIHDTGWSQVNYSDEPHHQCHSPDPMVSLKSLSLPITLLFKWLLFC
jgi:hypothetical protein